MFREMKLKRLSAILILIVAYLLLHFNTFAQSDLPVLELNTPVEREIEVGKPDSHQVILDEKKYVRFISKQIGVNSFVRIYSPDGGQIIEVRNFVDTGKENRVLLVTEKTGNYRIEIIPIGKENQRGKYELILEEIRDSNPQDQFLMNAQKTLLEAEKLHAQGSADSRKQAVVKYEEAASFWEKSGDFLGQADTLHYLGFALFSTGDLPKALEKTQKAQILYNKAKKPVGEATTFRGIGLMYHTLGKLDKALEFYDRGLSINRSLKNYAGEASDLGNIGGVYQYLGEYQKALDYYRKALEITQKFPDKRNEARLLNNIGSVYRLLTEYQKALEYFNQALELRRMNGDRRGVGTTLNNIALVYASLGDYSSAIEHFNLSLNARREIGDIRGESSTLNNLGFVQYKIGDYPKALEYLDKSLILRKKSSNRRAEASTLYILGRVYEALSDIDNTLDFYQQALTLSKEVKDRQTETAALKSIAEIEVNRGNLDEAEKLMGEAIDIVESLRSNLDVQSLRTTFLASRQDFYKSYIDLLMKQHRAKPEKGFDIEALQISEKARARSLVDLLSESLTQISKGIDLELLNQKKYLQLQINKKENQRANFVGRKGMEKRLELIEKDLSGLLAEYEEVKTQIRIKSPQYAELIEPQTLNVNEIQSLLDKDSVLLEYSLGEKQSYVWVVTNDSVKVYKLPNEQDIADATRRFYDLMTARNYASKNEPPEELQKRIAEADKKTAEAALILSKMIIHPFANELNKKRIVVVADGVLQYVPFGALSDSISEKPNNKQTYRPLILKYEMINLPSASTLAVLRKRNNKVNIKPNSIAIVADPVFSNSDPRVAQSIARLNNKLQSQPAKLDIKPDDSLLGELKRSANDLSIYGFRRLRFSRREADDIASFSVETDRFKAVDFVADRDLLMKEDLSKYKILHFATHGLLNNKNPELSGIVFSLVDEQGKPKDGFLRLYEIYNMQIGADLVVLSACQTALGKEIKGEGLIGLTRGFMYAGAESVVASLWKVEDRATAELMKKFYRAMLKDGQKPAEALRTAQIEMWREKHWGNPYHWAAFTLQGEWK